MKMSTTMSVTKDCLAVTTAVKSSEENNTSLEIIQKNVKKRWQSYIWDTFDKSPEERHFMFKLDFALLTMASLGYFIKNLHQTNINNAFVSGMKEDLNLYENEFNYMQTCWTIGCVIGEIPSNLVLTRVRPSVWIPCCELIWTVLTFSLARRTTAKQIYAVRFFIRLAGMQYIIGSWYRKDELAKRSCLFHVSSALAAMLSGYLMTGMIQLDGLHGLAGWQWLFLIDRAIGLPICIAGYFILPDVPEICKTFYFSAEELVFAKKRMELEGRKERAPYTRSKIIRILTSWRIWLLTLLYVCFNNSGINSQPVFAQYLKKEKYSVEDINYYPTGARAVQIVTTFLHAWLSDNVLNGSRWEPIMIGAHENLCRSIPCNL
ncbi:hypothetical protein HYALB_00006935 [Hymenoscyphus albidus]|uniref:Pantothenate transporter liz1 n=1 Tax=Hymenoscyphus albidus TaxID=595503 RepID=A0A9N9PX60_9HELO|nr:hypothetical protein HYALB_00006935 [Hymenoscyphus albidus]